VCETKGKVQFYFRSSARFYLYQSESTWNQYPISSWGWWVPWIAILQFIAKLLVHYKIGLSGKVACLCECEVRGASVTLTTFVTFQISWTIIMVLCLCARDSVPSEICRGAWVSAICTYTVVRRQYAPCTYTVVRSQWAPACVSHFQSMGILQTGPSTFTCAGCLSPNLFEMGFWNCTKFLPPCK
jgi:hypothetical protein